MFRVIAHLIVALALAATACKGGRKSTTPERLEPPVDVGELDLRGVTGLSGLARSEEGLWAVPERSRELVEIKGNGSIRRLAIEGVPDGVDLESLGSLGDGRFVFGTESSGRNGPDNYDGSVMVFAAVAGDRVVLGESLTLDGALWDLEIEHNEGVEGLCTRGSLLVAGLETAGYDDGRRFAPIAVYDRDADTWTAYRLWLTTKKGKLSALACDDGGGAFIAFERDFGVGRALRFSLPPGGGGIEPTIAFDFDAYVRRTGLNFEGLAVVGSRLVLIADNHYETVTGPNQIAEVPLSAATR